jgi:hypothetical protein
VDADDRFLGHGGDVGELLLDVAQHRVRDVAVAVGDADDERCDRERDEREPPLVDEEDDRDGDDREDVLREEDQSVAEEEAHRLEVDGGARHQLPGLVPVVEPEREAHELRVEAVTQVVLDPERLPAGDEAAADHEQRLDDADGDDQSDQEPQPVPVLLALELVDDEARQDEDRDRGRLRGDREHRRDDEREPVGAQEAEQAYERAAIGDVVRAHPRNLAAALFTPSASNAAMKHVPCDLFGDEGRPVGERLTVETRPMVVAATR